MTHPDFQQLIKQLVSENPDEQAQARKTLFVLDEDAISPLLDEYYAGVNEAQGSAILSLLTEMGGYEALNALRSICFFDLSTPLQLRKAAARGLLANRDSLSPDEYTKVVRLVNEESA
jgi:hypothetical protein